MEVSAAEQTVANLVLMVNFQGDIDNGIQNRFADNEGYQFVEEMYTQSSGGIHHYIQTISNGKVEVKSFFPQNQGDTFVPITISGTASSYFGTGDDSFIEAVITEVNSLVAKGSIQNITSDELDTWVKPGVTKDDCIDNVTFLVQINGGNIFNPHKGGASASQQLFGKYVRTYNILSTNDLILSEYGCLGGSSVAHEFLHTLGAADLYRRSGAEGEPVGPWDIMSNVQTPPEYPLAYTRQELGWLTIPRISESGDYVLQPVDTHSGNQAFIFRTAQSSSEFFVIEYRVKNPNYVGYESKLPESGLIVYRVNTSVDDHSNIRGENYIYVFRPGTAANHADASERNASGQNAVNDAVIGKTGRESLGKSEPSAPCTEDTIFYSDGTNSGIVISNIRYENNTASFHIEFPQANGTDGWKEKGDPISGLQSTSITGNEDGTKLYLAGIRMENYNYKLMLYQYTNDTGWTEMAQKALPVSMISRIFYADGQIYVAYENTSGNLCVAKWENGILTDCYKSSEQYPVSVELMYEEGQVWAAYHSGQNMYLANVSTGEKCASLQAATSNIVNPKAFYYQGKWYAVYGNFGAAGNVPGGAIACYEDGQWKDIFTSRILGELNQIDVCVSDSKVYIAAMDTGHRVGYLTWDGNGWQEEILEGVSAGLGLQIEVCQNIPYIVYGHNSVLKVKYCRDGVWAELAGSIANDAASFDALVVGGKLYVAISSSGGSTVVKETATIVVPTTPQQPEIGEGNVLLNIPDGYESDVKIFIDGVEYSAAVWNQDPTKLLVSIGSSESGNGMAQTAIMYRYNASGIPEGMYVWRLTYNGSYYDATAIPEFENLFSYHGFSVRYMGNTGLRCTFGIDSGKKAQLISAQGLNGYQLVEMGTLIMRPDNRENYPMVYGSDKVSGGRTYYAEGGRVYNKVIRTSNGRDHFANVLTNLPAKRYDTAYVFRPYAIVDAGGSRMVLYGPEMSRSMYTVCKQILGRGDFKPGTAGYQFLKNIVDSVEK